MTIITRQELKKRFEKGSIPTQQDFENLIDSMLHKQDEGLISQGSGLVLTPKGEASKLITFFNNFNDLQPTWNLEQYPKNDPHFGLNLTDSQGDSKLYIQANGNIGIGTIAPADKLTVDGNVSMHGRRGSYTSGKVLGDGRWHTIIDSLNECHAFEVMAKIGKKGRGLYAMTHAIALSTFGKSHNTIRHTKAYYGSFRNRIELRWSGDTFNYSLQIRTQRNYGEDSMIRYYVTNLWWEDHDEVA